MMSPVPSDLPPLLAALLESARYPHDAQQVELVQTHISWVLLAGDFAYKIKKPVKLQFLDFSTLAQRKIYCDEELRLNRRFAPDIYLDVVAIGNTPQDPRFGVAGAPIEYAVRMRRFDEAGRLDHVCARGELHSTHMSDLADSLAAFHTAAAVAPAASDFGAAEVVMASVQENFADLLRLLPNANLQARLATLQLWMQTQFQRLAPVMESRKRSGRVRECHGDLHLANLALIKGQVRMFDCIEFNEGLRWIDVASEIAFVYADLLAHEQPALADWFVDEVLSRSGDYQAAQVLRFYAVYRALVRAKVAAIRHLQIGVSMQEPVLTQPTGRDQTAAEYIGLAERLIAVHVLRLVITHGLSGCGKTVASGQLLQSDQDANTLRLRSDVERKRLFGLANTERSRSPIDGGIYAPDAHARTYAHLRDLAMMLISAGWSVIVDASFLKRTDRDTFRTLARNANVAFAILAPQATPALLRQRIVAREEQGGDASEATLSVLTRQTQTIDMLADDEYPTRLALAGVQDMLGDGFGAV